MDPIYMAGPSITEKEIETVLDAMRTGWYEKPYWYVENFQREFAAWHGRKHALMTPNCTTALHLLLTGLGVDEDSEVIVPDCTWIASAAAVTYLGAKTVFADIDRKHWCLDPESVEKKITSKTKAIIAVDLFGNMPYMDELVAVAEKHGIPLVEDAAEALGSTYKGRKAGTFGVGSTFSFHRTKTLTTGEGGMLILDDDKLFERCTVLRDHGRRPGGKMYYNEEVTYKYMPFNLQAALGYAQFHRLDELIARKREIFEWYKEGLADVEDIQLNAEPEGGFNSVWITAVVFGKSHNMNKETAMQKLQEVGIPSRPFFYPLSSLPAYPGREEEGRRTNPNAYDIADRGINLAGAMNLTRDQTDAICDGIKTILGVGKRATAAAR
ncbi:MAG TPA: DegT/DnrJ/EryC1/StrS family aminotransferase [Thermoanaerobaculia bacterium]|nr:DegT/DnrJ/EryC1/StrS family aminotransferase [Thermoanaerobaculia bacterium]